MLGHADHARVELDGVRSARANALNCVSTTWCALRPASTLTCSVIRASAHDRLEDVLGQRGVVAADELDDLGLVVHEVGPAGQVDGHLHERLVERHERVAEPADAGLVAERLAQRLAERERGVLDRVVGVDLAGRPSVRTVRSKPPCLPIWASMWSKNGTPVSTSVTPVPSSSSSTRTSLSLVVRCTRADLLMP